MAQLPLRRAAPLSVDIIVDAACAVIAETGLDALSMRRLGAELGVDPMAVYHHVENKRELLSLVTGRVVGAMALPSADAPWDARLREWAAAYRDVVMTNRDLVVAGLADPVIAAGGLPSVAPLTTAIADSGIPPDLVEPNAWLVVDFVHGAGLGAAAPHRHTADDLDALRRAFDAGVDTIVAGIAARR
jgi:TetR/AcrR family transcriptional regulator, tetracycline repressor protein